MTQKTKLEIIGEYREDHPGPFCTRDGGAVEILTHRDRRGNILGYQSDSKELTVWRGNGQFDKTGMSNTAYDLMCAREVPVAFECWVIVGESKPVQMRAYPSAEVADMMQVEVDGMKRLIHMREVLPGEGA